jgi:hypothetical protein
MFPDGDRNGPLAADCAVGVGGGAGGGVTVTVTVGVESCVAVGIGVDAIVGTDVDGEDAGVPDGAWTAVEPADDEHPVRVTAASAARNARPRQPVARVARARCRSCEFFVIPQGCGEGLGDFLTHEKLPFGPVTVEAARCRR